MRIIIETRLLRYVSEGLLFTSEHIKGKLSKTKEICRTGAGYSKACLSSGTFFSTSLIWIRIQRKPYGEDFPHTQINIFSPLCFLNEIRTVVKLTNHEQCNK